MQTAETGLAYYSDQELAKLLGISLGALRNKVARGDELPPRVCVPGLRKRLWPTNEVDRWLSSHTTSGRISPIRAVARRHRRRFQRKEPESNSAKHSER